MTTLLQNTQSDNYSLKLLNVLSKNICVAISFLRTAVLITSVLLCSQHTQAKSFYNNYPLKPWQSQVPSALLPINGHTEELVNLLQDGVLIYPQPEKKVAINLTIQKKLQTVRRPAQFVTSAVIVNAPPHRVRQVLSNYTGYPKIFPKLVSAKILKKNKTLTRVKYRAVIDLPLPILKFDEEFIFRHQLRKNSLSTWIEDSPIKYGMGQFEWHGINSGNYAGKTLVTLTQWGDLDNMNGFLLPKIVKAMPEIKLSIPNGVNAYVLEALRLHFNGKDSINKFNKSQLLPNWQQRVNQNTALINQLMKHTQALPVMYAHPPRYLKSKKSQIKLRFVSSIQRMPASSNTVNKWLMNPKTYPRLFKQVKKVSSKPHTLSGKSGKLVTTDIKVGLGVISIPFQTKLFYQKLTANQARFSAAGGDVKWIEGAFYTRNSGKNSSLLLTTLAQRTDKNAPFLLRIGNALPYNHYLSSVGFSPILSHKINKKIKK